MQDGDDKMRRPLYLYYEPFSRGQLSNNMTLQFKAHATRQFLSDDPADAPMQAGAGRAWDELGIQPHMEWEAFQRRQCVVVLGEPNIGKSRELAHQMAELTNRGKRAFLTELKSLYESDKLLKKVSGLKEAFESGEEFFWFVDSLDEGRLQSEEVVAGFMQLLEQMESEGRLGGLRLRLSCRTAEWRQKERDRLSSVFKDGNDGSSGFMVVRMMPLSQKAIEVLATEKLVQGAKVRLFFDACRRHGVVNLAGFPLLLGSMLQQFQTKGVFSEDRTSLFNQATCTLLDEINTAYIDGDAALTTLPERLRVAQTLASRLVLIGVIQFKERDAAELMGPSSGDDLGTRRRLLKETLASGLFIRHPSGEHEFVHRSFAEFCAAQAFVEVLETKPLKGILPAFTVEGDGIPSAMRETASFLAGMNSAFQDWLVKADPVAASDGDTRKYSDSNRLQLVRKLEQLFEGRAYQGEFSRYGDLAHGIPEVDIRRMLQVGRAIAIRALAIEIIAGSRRSELLALLVDLAKDPNELPDFRVRAIEMLCWIDVAKYGPELKAGVKCDQDDVANDEIVGALLQGLYPGQMSAEEVMGYLHAPRASGRVRFKEFWSKDFWAHPLSIQQRHNALEKFAEMFGNLGKEAHSAATVNRLREISGLAVTLKAVFEAFCEQLRAEVVNGSYDIGVLGPWVRIAAKWSERYARLAPVVVGVSPEDRLFRAKLLAWAASSAPADQSLRPASDVPYFKEAFGISDFDLLLDFVEENVADHRVSIPVFIAAVNMAASTGQSDPARAARIEKLAQQSPDHAATLEGHLYDQEAAINLDLQHRNSMTDESDHHDPSPHRHRDEAALAELAAGDAWEVLEGLSSTVTGLLSQRFLVELAALRPDVNAAVRQGVLAAWHRFSEPESLWAKNKVHNVWSPPEAAFVAGVGFWIHCESLANDLELTLTAAQAELLVWMAINSDDEFDRLLSVAWQVSKGVVTARLTALLKAEHMQDQKTLETLWPRLMLRENLPPDLVEAVRQFALSHPDAESPRVRAGVLAFLWRRASDQLAELAKALEPKAIAELRKADIAKQDEKLALQSLALVWLVDEKSADRFGPVVFGGPAHLQRAIAFIDAVTSIQKPGAFYGWAVGLPAPALGRLVPYLYSSSEQPVTDANQRLSVGARDNVFQYLAEQSDVQLVLAWFEKWKTDDRYGNLKSYLAARHAELRQKSYDSVWKPMRKDAAAAIFDPRLSVLRTSRDVAYFLDGVIESKLVPAFLKDASLTPLLWGKRDELDHEDEKHVQTAVYGLLRVYVQESKIVGAREPEQSDGKKPDIRLDFMDGGHVSVPIEIKWSDHADVWRSIDTQLVQLYMKDPDIRYGVYLVAWSGDPVGNSPAGIKPSTAAEMLAELKKEAAKISEARGKQISVHVIDATRSAELTERRAAREAALKGGKQP